VNFNIIVDELLIRFFFCAHRVLEKQWDTRMHIVVIHRTQESLDSIKREIMNIHIG
jgi:hypothetical protein